LALVPPLVPLTLLPPGPPLMIELSLGPAPPALVPGPELATLFAPGPRRPLDPRPSPVSASAPAKRILFVTYDSAYNLWS
jgi:hypothetical protein